MKAVTVTTDDAIDIIEVKENGSPLYKQMSEAVGGYYENVYPRRFQGEYQDFVMVVNEEGLIKGLPLNRTGCFLYGTDIHGSPIVGNVIILKKGYFEGEPDIVALTDEEAEKVKQYLMNNVQELKGAKNND